MTYHANPREQRPNGSIDRRVFNDGSRKIVGGESSGGT